MADATVSFTSTGDACKKYKISESDSCGSTAAGSWAVSSGTKIGSYTHTAATYTIEICPPSSSSSGSYTLKWTGGNTGTTKTIDVSVNIANYVFTHADGTTTTTVSSTGITADTKIAVLYFISKKDDALDTSVAIDDETCDWVTGGTVAASGNTSGPNAKVTFTLTENTSTSDRQCEFTIRQTASGKTLKCKIQQAGKVDPPAQLIKSWSSSDIHSGGREYSFTLSDEAIANGVKPEDVTLWVSIKDNYTMITSQSGGCRVKWGIKYAERSGNSFKILMYTENQNNVSDGCFTLGCVGGPYDVYQSSSMLPTDRLWIMVEQQQQVINGKSYLAYSGSVSGGIGFASTQFTSCTGSNYVFLYGMP